MGVVASLVVSCTLVDVLSVCCCSEAVANRFIIVWAVEV